MFVDYYKLIQVHPECEGGMIKRMRKVWAMKYHPDVVNESEKGRSTELMQKVNAAIDMLLDPVKRQAYNATHPYFSVKRANSSSDSSQKNSNKRSRKQYSGNSASTDEYVYCADFATNLQGYLKADILFGIAKKAKQRGAFTGFERRQYYNFATRINNNLPFTYWQKKNFKLYITMAIKKELL